MDPVGSRRVEEVGKGQREETRKEVREKKEKRRAREKLTSPNCRENTEGPADLAHNRNAASKTRQSEALISRGEATALRRVTRVLNAATNVTRLQILAYCVKPRRFTEVVKFHKMNPASFKFHERILRSENLMRKEGNNGLTLYHTTNTGKLVLDLVRGPVRSAMAKS